ncbi:DUF2283 domain-containing protein [Rhodopila sp.]|uniref:DUF2283 domain-containing protein n=1 Tax=Rhodopila sp. TaxID=2480087 RepID=UPI003D0C1CEB
MMRTSYDPEVNAFEARFVSDNVEIAQTTEVAPDVMLDLDADGQLVHLEVLSVAVRGAGSYGTRVPDAAG